MKKNEQACLTSVLVQRFLDEQLTDEENGWIEAHLGDCSKCRHKLESVVTHGRGWDVFREHLFDFNFSEEFSESEGEPGKPEWNDLLAPTDDPSKLGRLGRYEICGVIGQGSMGIVFKAHDARLNRFVAIKLLAPSFASLGRSRQRFEREGRAIASVRDPHVIEVHGVDEYQRRPYIVMQYMPDGSLQKRLNRNGLLTTKEVCRIGMQVAKGLAAAHRQGIIHRDIKPANILLQDGIECAVVSDFGLARVADEATMTRSGTIAGTPQFMSPEQARGDSLDMRSDLFSLGCVMYATCTGRSPFESETLIGVVHRVCEQEPRPIREINPEIDPWLQAFVEKLLRKKREDRFQSAEQVAELLADELAHLQMPEAKKLPERSWWRSESRTKNTKGSNLIVAPFRWVVGIGLFALVTMAVILAINLNKNGKTDVINRWGIEPTVQEASYTQAKSAYDLAYETHINEVELRGDMKQSIDAHLEAYELGYNKSQSAYNLARAYAYQGSTEEAFTWMDAAIKAGFRDVDAIRQESDFRKVRNDARYAQIVKRIDVLARKYAGADLAYFGDRDYSAAETQYRALLKECPQDEFALMMIGAALLEQGKLNEAKTWNQRTRHSVRYSNFGSYNLGCIAALEGEKDLAFRYLNFAVDTRFTDADHLENDYHLVALRDDSRFKKLLRRMRQSNQNTSTQ